MKSYQTTIKLSLLAGLDWLIISVLLALTNEVQIMARIPGPDTAFSFGILRPIYTTTLIFGAGLSFFFGAAFYLIQKSEQVELKFELAGLAALLLTNLGVLLGVVTILLGFNKGREFGEMTFLSDNLVALGLLVFLVVVLISLNGKENPGPAAAFSIAAAAGGLVVFLLGNIGQPYGPLVSIPLNAGVKDLSVQEYYRTGLLGFLIVMPALAMAYHFIPSKFDVELRSPSAARFQLIALVVMASLAGAAGLVYTPAPGLLQSIGIAFGLAFSFAVIIGGVNLFQTMRMSSGPPVMDGERRFLRWGLYFLLTLAWLRVLTGFRWSQEIFAFTFISPLDISTDALFYGAMISLGAAFIIGRELAGQKEATTGSKVAQGFYLAGLLLILIADFSHSLIASSALRELTTEGTPAITTWTGVIFSGSAFEVESLTLKYFVSFRGLGLIGHLSLLIGLVLGTPGLYKQLLTGLDLKSLLPELPASASTTSSGGNKDYMLVEEERN